MPLFRRFLVGGVTACVLACSGGGGGATDPYGNNNGNNNGPPTGGGNTALNSIDLSFTQAGMIAGQVRTITVTARDTQGAIIAGITPYFTSSDEAVAEVDASGDIVSVHAGSAQINISVTVGTVTKNATASVVVSGSLPNAGAVTAGTDQTFQPGTLVLAQGSSVTWNFGTLSHTVTFTSAGNGTPASIPESYSTSVVRVFQAKGNFSYICSIHAGMSGEVIVR